MLDQKYVSLGYGEVIIKMILLIKRKGDSFVIKL